MQQFKYGLLGILLIALAAMTGCAANSSESVTGISGNNPAYSRLVILSDVHLPFRAEKVKEAERQQRIMDAKNKVINDINGWNDVNGVAILGDLAASTGNAEERRAVAQYLSAFEKPLAVINGNHDYLYKDELSAQGKRIKGTPQERQSKLMLFQNNCGLETLYRSKGLAGYRLIFLSANSLTTSYLTQLSPEELTWLRQELWEHRTEPTIIFFHAPLAGTISGYTDPVKIANDFAQPAAEIAEILDDNHQVFLWISGHTHTPATSSNFASEVNLYHGRIWNIHNADMDRETIWSNSLYLYPDKVIVKTFNHATGQWLDSLTRTITPPLLTNK